MDDKKKILLGDTDIISRDNEDLFIDINLNRTFSEYKKEKFDNDFDLQKQFDEERNASRDFNVYGFIQATYISCNNLSYDVWANSGLTIPVLNQAFTTNVQYTPQYNIFNKRMGRYYFTLSNYTGKSIFIRFFANPNQVFEQQLVFYDATGQFVPYGTQTIEVDNDLNTVEINNDFPFFYNKHWVKKNIFLENKNL
jgi:hypothetical protein